MTMASVTAPQASAAPRLAAPPLSAAWTNAVVPEADTYSRSHRGVIIDLDDTLYPRARFVRSGFAAVARHCAAAFGIPVDAAYGTLLAAHENGGAGHELQHLLERFGIHADTLPVLLDVYRRHMPVLWFYHDVAAALDRLRAAGWRIAVLTNGLPSVQFRKVAALGLAAHVDDVVYAEEHAAGGKPGAAAFRAALESLDVRPDQCVCVGDDAARDIRGARALGLRTIRVARHGQEAAAPDEADAVVETLEHLPELAAMLLDVVTADVA